MKRAFLPLLVCVLGVYATYAACAALPAHAQAADSNTLSVIVSPQYPQPYQVVTITPSSNLIDLSASAITISANGAVIEKGSGMQSAQTQVGAVGTKTVITVSAVNGGHTYTSQVTLIPANVSLIVEPVSTTHPFYKGAPLLASEGTVRLVALADLRTASGALIPSSTLIYTWKHDDQVLQASSGIGKSILVGTAPVRYRDANVTVTVSTPDSSIVAQASTVLSPVDPAVRLYRDDPLLGPWFNTALGSTYTMADAEETFRAVPYYFAAAPSLTWSVNGTPSETNPDITVRGSGTGGGTAVLDAAAKTTGQVADAALSVVFGTAKSLGIFGL